MIVEVYARKHNNNLRCMVSNTFIYEMKILLAVLLNLVILIELCNASFLLS